MKFAASPEPTVGVEIEVALVDAETMALRSACPAILERLTDDEREGVKPELLQCYLEANSRKCHTIAEVESDLAAKFQRVESIAYDQGLRLLWTATHPFSMWRDQDVTDNERYRNLVHQLRDTARQLVTFGLHVHVGVDSGDKAVMICDRMLRHLPTLLAASCNSPFWDGRVTGLQSWRSRVMDGLPTAGLPPLMRNWSEYVWLVTHLEQTGFIKTIREIWWDLRPHHNFGTVEVRICDIPANLHDTMAIAALIHSMVKVLSDEIDEGTYQHDCHPMLVRQNKWRAARYGLDAQLVDSRTYELKPARRTLLELVDAVRPGAEALRCTAELERVVAMAERPNWSQVQLDILEKTNNAAEVVREMTGFSSMLQRSGV